MVMSPVGIGTKNHCAGEGQQQFSSQCLLPGSRPCRMATISHQPHYSLTADSELSRVKVKVSPEAEERPPLPSKVTENTGLCVIVICEV
jgi:hypothetical protein